MKKIYYIIPILIGFITTLGVMFISNKTKTLNEKDIIANNRMALFIEKDGTYEKTNTIPSGGYVLNSSKSKCSNDAIPKWNSNTKSLKLSNLTKDNTSCYLYFDLTESGKTLTKLNLTSNGEVKEFTGPSCNEGCTLQQNGVYEAEDDFGTSYYFRGSVDNNWVVFGKDTTDGEKYIWWRIIRVNGNGTIRLIYAGTSTSDKIAPSSTGEETMITPRTPADSKYPKSVKFNTSYNDNKYIGYMFGGKDGDASTSYDQAHTPETQSTILQEIVDWYNNKTNLGSLATNYIDVDTGFCGDRTYTTNIHGSYLGAGDLGWKNTPTVYGAEKVWPSKDTNYRTDEQITTFKCTTPRRDLYTGPNATEGGINGLNGNVEGNNALPVPVGLITMDEIIYAGGFAGQTNNEYWLKTDKYYWTMSPSVTTLTGNAQVFIVTNEGYLGNAGVYSTTYGVRPVINLKADTMFTFDNNGKEGTPENPYIVEI